MEERMTTKEFPVFDADSHVVEPTALWEKYLDPEYRTLGKHALWRQEGRTGDISRSMARCSATRATPTCRAPHFGGRAWIGMRSARSTPTSSTRPSRAPRIR